MKIMKIITAVISGTCGFLWGQFDGLLYALIVFMVLDYLSGVIVAITQKELSSSPDNNRGYPTIANIINPKRLGAFCGCTNLRKVNIPESVKSIGEYAFSDTALTSVKIASDCVYSQTSFPEGCSVSFYE